MALKSGTFCWDIGEILKLKFTLDQGVITDPGSASGTYLGEGGNSIVFDAIYGTVDSEGGIHMTGSSFDPSTSKYTHLSLSGGVDPNNYYFGTCSFTIMLPDGTSIDEPPMPKPGKERGTLGIVKCS